MPTPSNPPLTVDSLLRVVEARDAEVALLKLMVEKLKMQLLRRARAQFGPSSEHLDGAQIALIEGKPLDELLARQTPAKAQAANAAEVDRKLPAHLPREAKTYRPRTNDIRTSTSSRSAGSSKPTPMAAGASSTIAGASSRRHVGLTPDGPGGNCT